MRQSSLVQLDELRYKFSQLPRSPTDRFTKALLEIYRTRIARLLPGEALRPSDLKGLELDIGTDLAKDGKLEMFHARCVDWFSQIGVLDNQGRRLR